MNLLNSYGIIKIREVISIYKFIIICIILGILIITFLSNIIFNVQVIHTSKEVRKFILNELEEYGLKKYNFKKSFLEIQEIKNKILDEYKDTIEWLEIEESGTSYIVRLEERIIPDTSVDETTQDVVATRDAIIRKIIASKGNVIKELNTYVNKGDVIISGSIYLNDTLKEIVGAKVTIYGEVWYNVTVEYPYIYSEIKETGNYKNVYVIKLLNKEIELTLDKYKDKTYEEDIILSHSLIPISIVKQKQKELNTIALALTLEEATNKALEEAINKMNIKLENDEYIINHKVLKTNIKDDKVILNVFFAVYEDITGYSKIEGE